MLPGRYPTPEDIQQGALDEGTNGNAQVMLAAVLLTPTGDYRAVSMQEYVDVEGACLLDCAVCATRVLLVGDRISLVRTGTAESTRGVRVEITGAAVPIDPADKVAFTSPNEVYRMFEATGWHTAPRVSLHPPTNRTYVLYLRCTHLPGDALQSSRAMDTRHMVLRDQRGSQPS